jgi:hypothetical protein
MAALAPALSSAAMAKMASLFFPGMLTLPSSRQWVCVLIGLIYKAISMPGWREPGNMQPKQLVWRRRPATRARAKRVQFTQAALKSY